MKWQNTIDIMVSWYEQDPPNFVMVLASQIVKGIRNVRILQIKISCVEFGKPILNNFDCIWALNFIDIFNSFSCDDVDWTHFTWLSMKIIFQKFQSTLGFRIVHIPKLYISDTLLIRWFRLECNGILLSSIKTKSNDIVR